MCLIIDSHVTRVTPPSTTPPVLLTLTLSPFSILLFRLRSGFVASASPICSQGYWGVLGVPPCYQCSAGTFASGYGASSASCDGPCSAGYYCYSGSTSPYQYLCTPGLYSYSGSSSCSPCAPGTYGSNYGMTNSSCSGPAPLATRARRGPSMPP